jgi:hypothetical protein
MVCRWAFNRSSHFVTRNGLRVLEVLVLRRKSDGKCILPGGFIGLGLLITLWTFVCSPYRRRKHASQRAACHQQLHRSSTRLHSSVVGTNHKRYSSRATLSDASSRTRSASFSPKASRYTRSVDLTQAVQHMSDTSQGYLDDKRNTDHAWLETRIRHYHDDSSTLLKWIEFTSKPSDAMAYEWVGISQAIPIVPHQLQYVLKVCIPRAEPLAHPRRL